MNKAKLAAVTLIMTEMGITLKELFDYQVEIGKSQYDEMTAESPEEKEWLDENVRGKEEELRGRKIEVQDGSTK